MSLNVRFSTLIVTDDHNTSEQYSHDVYQWVEEEKKGKNSNFHRVRPFAKRKFGALMAKNVKRKQRIGHFVPALNCLFLFFPCSTDPTHLTNICAKGEGLKCPRGFFIGFTVDF